MNKLQLMRRLWPDQKLNRTSAHQRIFTDIHRRDMWGGSGTGSRESSTRPYRLLLQWMIANYSSRRIVDVGCGDWEFSRLINWGGVHYLGIDVVDSLVHRVRGLYGSANIRFCCMDVLRDEVPDGELYLVKDVLQHWTGAEVLAFLRKMKGRQMLITNTVVSQPYRELALAGAYRPLDIRRAPFRWRAEQVLRYEAGPRDSKLVLLLSPGKTGR